MGRSSLDQMINTRSPYEPGGTPRSFLLDMAVLHQHRPPLPHRHLLQFEKGLGIVHERVPARGSKVPVSTSV